ncbi:MAG: hypothetical protein HDR20_16055 [Lachnospiraceae bacterium]|nr:hypothetical protein [Lachnospiraceae bacterium]
MNSMSQINMQKKQERKREKLERKKEKLRRKRWKRINSRIERGIVFLAAVVFGVSVLLEIDEARKGNHHE